MTDRVAASSASAEGAAAESPFSASPFPILPFHRQILDDLAAQDGLVILARGLGLPQLLFHLIAHYAATSHLVFVLNLSEHHQRDINERLSALHQHSLTHPSSAPSPSPVRPPRLLSITNHVPPAERQRLYLAGGVLSVTCRILLVDLLNKVIAADLVSGLVLCDAHRCDDESAEAFIVRLYRQGNAHGFLKAFSDEPAAFSSGFFGLDKIMRALHLRSLQLYPRFHLAVQRSLSVPEEVRPDVHEMYQPLTPSMDLIQRALLECMDLCISALKHENKLGAAILNVTIDSGLTTAFDAIIRRELDPVWHRVSPRSRQLVADLGALRQCIGYLINYDSVTFYRYLLSVRAHSQASTYSMWLLTEPADRLFKQAKGRVYQFESALLIKIERDLDKKKSEDVLARARASIDQLRGGSKKRKAAGQGKPAKRGRGGRAQAVEVLDVDDESVEAKEEAKAEEKADEAAPTDRIRLVLEENPKWNLLVDVLQEIEEDVLQARVAAKEANRGKGGSKERAGPSNGGKVTKEGRVLICCVDERTCSLLKRYLEEGGRAMMKQLWRTFLFKQRARKHTASSPATSAAAAINPLPSHVPAAAPNQASPWALMAAETAALRRELDRVISQHNQARMKKFEREHRRRMEREAEEKRRADIGHDQVTLTQHMRSAEARKRKEEEEQAKKSAAAERAKELKRRKEAKEKERRLAALSREEDDDDGVLRDVLMMRDKRQQQIDDLSDDDAEDADADDAERDEAAARKKKEDDWGVLSVCDVALHLRSSQQDDASLPSTQSSHRSAEEAALEDGDDDLWHVFDEEWLHTLPSFTVLLHASSDVDLMLYRFQPHYVVMFDPDLTVLREVEVYAAYHPQLPVTAYYLQYNNSVEEQKYLATIKHEKDAFDQLIFQKQHMVVPSDIEGKSVGLGGSEATVQRNAAMLMPRGEVDDGGGMRFNTYEAYVSTLPSKGTAVNTRRGGDMSVQVSGTVIVDVREFRSSLPSLLHARGLTIVPVTLEVGDYVLSPHICVERKSLSDLFSSFLSGRLFKQMEVMTRHYRSPVLLIEFDRRRPFALLSKGELGADISSRHIMAKIAVLCIHFPQVRMVWSRDAHVTSQTFLALKKNQAEPELDGVALSMGAEVGVGGVGHMVGVGGIVGGGVGGEEDDERAYAMMSFDMLRKLPGVNATNMRLLVEHCGSLKELCAKKVTELMVWMGESNARKLYHFLHTSFAELFT